MKAAANRTAKEYSPSEVSPIACSVNLFSWQKFVSALRAKYILPELNKGMERLRKAQCKRIHPARHRPKSTDYIVSHAAKIHQ